MSGVPRPPLLVIATELGLDAAHRVVAEVAGQAATEARQAGGHRGLQALLETLDEAQRIAFVALDDRTVGHHLGEVAGGADQRARRQADERVAAEAFAADDGLQQEAVALVADQLQVQRQRRFEIRKGLADERDAVVAKGGQALEFEFGDHVSGPRNAVVLGGGAGSRQAAAKRSRRGRQCGVARRQGQAPRSGVDPRQGRRVRARDMLHSV